MARVIHGDTGGNQLNVSADKTQVYGLSGNDTIISDNKKDALLIGGSGNDSLIMMGGNGTLNGGKGKDTFELTYSADKPVSAVIEDFDPTEDKIVVNHDGDTAPQLTSEVKGNDVIWTDGGNFNLTLKGVRENDYFDDDAPEQVWEVLEITNAEREAQGLSALTLSEDLTAGASIRVQEITELATQSKLEVERHRRPNGEHFSTVLKQKYASSPGENLDAGARSPLAVVKDWMTSEAHKKNILNETFRKLGVGYNYYDEGGSSALRYYWTQLFADSLKSPDSVSSANLLTASIETNAVSKSIEITDNTYENADYGATISGTSFADSISNSGVNVSVFGSDGADTIINSGLNSTINAGMGDDSISLATSAENNLVEYATGDGNDTICGFHSGDTVSISGDEFTPATVGNDVVIAVGTDSIKLLDAKDLSMYILGTKSNLIILTDDDNDYTNDLDDATIKALDGDDTITNHSDNASIEAGAGNDVIRNYGEFVTINAGAGNDNIDNWGGGNFVEINAGAGNDVIYNQEDYAIINSGEDDDDIETLGFYVTIDAGDGKDFISNGALTSHVSINGGDGDDYIENQYECEWVTIDGGNGDDMIYDLYGVNVLIYGGSGNDRILIESLGITIRGGTGDDLISLYGSQFFDEFEYDYYYDETEKLIEYSSGDGNDTVWGFDSTATLSISGGTYIRSTVGNDVVVAVGTDSITLVDAASLEDVNIYGIGEESKFIKLTEGDDSINSTLDNATIDALGGDDFIANYSDSLSINGGANNDYIDNSGSNVNIDGGDDNDTIVSDGSNTTINGGRDNDIIVLSSGAQDNLIEYRAGDGLDTLDGLKETDTLRIGDGTGTYSTQTSGNHIIAKVDTGRILLWNAASLAAVNIDGIERVPSEENNTISLTDDVNTYLNTLEGATIYTYGGDNSITNAGNNTYIDGEGNNSITNTGNNVEIIVGDGNDSISNAGNNVYIYDIAGNETIDNSGNNSTIYGGLGDDQISLRSGSRNNLIVYRAGDGNDTVWGFNLDNEIEISGGEYVRYMVGNNLVFAVDTDSLTLVDAASLTAFIPYGTGKDNKFIELTDEDDYFINNGVNVTIEISGDEKPIISDIGVYATINGKDGNDRLENLAPLVSISGGAGNDSIQNIGFFALSVTISGGDGNDFIYNYSNDVFIDGGEGNNKIYNESILGNIDNNYGTNVTISSGAGDDTVYNHDGWYCTINTGAGNDSVYNWNGDYSTINTGAGNDSVYNSYTGDSVTIDGGDGNDTVYNSGSNVSIDAGDGKDNIENDGDSVTIDSGAGDDVIDNVGSYVSIEGGKGDDVISLSSYSQNNLIQYTEGDGNDTIWGLDDNASLRIGDGTGTYSTLTSDDDVIVKVGTGSITLKNYRGEPEHVIIGDSGSSGGGSDSGGDNGGGGNSSGGNDNGGNGSGNNGSGNNGSGNNGSGNNGGNSSGNNNGGNSSGNNNGGNSSGNNNSGNPSGGGSQNEGKGSDATPGQSATGSQGNQSSNANNNGGGNSQNISFEKIYAELSKVTPTPPPANQNVSSDTATPAIVSNVSQNVAGTAYGGSVFDALTSATPVTATNPNFYAGGNQIIADYQSGQKIMLGTLPTGYAFGGDNFALASETGTLLIQNVKDKVIEFTDGAGNDFLKAYAATNPGLIDGRGLAGFEVINGSDAGSDLIFAGDNSSSLWGGADNVADTLVGGNGVDIFVGGKNQGADTFLNASANDVVFLSDSTLSDVVATAGTDNAVAVAFNTGNVIAVQSSEPLSAAFLLADGSAYRFNHVTKSWQTA